MDKNKKDDPILNMTPKQVTRVRMCQRLLLIPEQPQRTSIHRGPASTKDQHPQRTSIHRGPASTEDQHVVKMTNPVEA